MGSGFESALHSKSTSFGSASGCCGGSTPARAAGAASLAPLFLDDADAATVSRATAATLFDTGAKSALAPRLPAAPPGASVRRLGIRRLAPRPATAFPAMLRVDTSPAAPPAAVPAAPAWFRCAASRAGLTWAIGVASGPALPGVEMVAAGGGGVPSALPPPACLVFRRRRATSKAATTPAESTSIPPAAPPAIAAILPAFPEVPAECTGDAVADAAAATATTRGSETEATDTATRSAADCGSRCTASELATPASSSANASATVDAAAPGSTASVRIDSAICCATKSR